MKGLSKTGISAILLSSSLTIMVGTAIAPSLKEISVNLGFTHNPGWLITLPALGVILSAPIMGKLIDRKGPLAIMCWGLVPYGILGIAGIWLRNPLILIADRIFLGAATAAVQASGTSLIATFFKDQSRLKMIAWQGMAIEMGGVIFLSLGGILGMLDWRYPFLIYLLAFFCLALILTGFPKTKVNPLPSSFFQTAIIPRNMVFIIAGVTLSMLLFFIVFVGLPQYLPRTFGFTSAQTGYLMAFISLIAVCSASLMPVVTRHIGTKHTITLGFIFFMTAHILFAIPAHIGSLVIAAIATGTGFGFTIPLFNHLTIEESEPHNRGRNLGYYSMGIFGGQFLSSFSGLLAMELTTTFSIAAGLALLIAILIFLNTEKTTPLANNNF